MVPLMERDWRIYLMGETFEKGKILNEFGRKIVRKNFIDIG